MDEDGDGEKSTTTFRWINVARYAVASVMSVLIATVVIVAIKTVVRPETLIFSINGGCVSVVSLPRNQLQFQISLQADNPSGRTVMYYYNITGFLFDKNTSAATQDPLSDAFVALQLRNKTVNQNDEVLSFSQQAVSRDLMTESYFDMLHNNRSARIDDVTMRMEGYLVTEPFSGYNTSARWTTYYCSPLVVRRSGQDDDDEANNNTQGSVLCTEVLDSSVTPGR